MPREYSSVGASLHHYFRAWLHTNIRYFKLNAAVVDKRYVVRATVSYLQVLGHRLTVSYAITTYKIPTYLTYETGWLKLRE